MECQLDFYAFVEGKTKVAEKRDKKGENISQNHKEAKLLITVDLWCFEEEFKNMQYFFPHKSTFRISQEQ